MEDFEPSVIKSINMYQHHLDYLNSINKNNLNAAFRQSIDRLIELDRRQKRVDYLNGLKDNILIISIGMIFLLFGSIANTLLISITSLGIGIFFSSYGIFTLRVKRT